MNDARWFEVQQEMEAAVRHFQCSVELFEKGGFDKPGLDGYQAEMAMMHALQSAHTSFESGLVRILEILDEERPQGENWHAALIKRAASDLPGRRPAILGQDLARAANETRRFRHRATHNYDSFDIHEIGPTVAAAKIIAERLIEEIAIFKEEIDPDEDHDREYSCRGPSPFD